MLFFRCFLYLALLLLPLTTQAQTSPVSVSLKANPRVKDLPETFLQDQMTEKGRRDLLLKAQSKEEQGLRASAEKKAQLYYQKGRDIFQQGDYSLAQKYFEKATRLDANIDQYYHELAIALYKNGNYRRSAALLALLEGRDVNQAEVQYYSGLNFYRMKKMEYALNKFKTTQEMKDEVLSPLAAMYSGLSYSQMEKFKEAKESFQNVLDTSNDSKLDEQAESYIENIEQYEIFRAEAAKKWAYSMYTGFAYDSNVLNVAASNVSTGTAAYRFLYGGSVSYKALYKQNKSLLPTLAISDIYSFDKNFQSEARIQGTDPLQIDFSTPFKYTFSAFGSPMNLSLTPGYLHLYMSLGQSSRELTFSSAYLYSKLSTSHFKDIYTDYKFNISNDDSHVATTNKADDQTANKYTLGVTNTWLINKKGNQTLFNDLYFIKNNANGDNNTYNKSLANLGYSFPWSESFTAYTKVEYFHQDFIDSSAGRVDNNISLSLGGFYSLSAKSMVTILLMYMQNNSTVSYFDYNKFSITTLWSFNSSFF